MFLQPSASYKSRRASAGKGCWHWQEVTKNLITCAFKQRMGSIRSHGLSCSRSSIRQPNTASRSRACSALWECLPQLSMAGTMERLQMHSSRYQDDLFRYPAYTNLIVVIK